MKPQRRRTGPLDWQKARDRLERAARATEEALSPSAERSRAILAERARELARVPEAKIPASETLEAVTFALASERHGIETRFVREVVRLTNLTPLPGAPEFLAGVTNLRGLILAVIDLRKFFGVPTRGLTDLSRVIVLGEDRPEFGVLADAVHEVIVLPTDQVLEPPATVAGIAREYVRGVTRDALIVLDGQVLLHDPRLFIDEGEEAGA